MRGVLFLFPKRPAIAAIVTKLSVADPECMVRRLVTSEIK